MGVIFGLNIPGQRFRHTEDFLVAYNTAEKRRDLHGKCGGVVNFREGM